MGVSVSAIDVAQAAALYRSGLSCDGIGLILGHPGPAVRRRLERAGVALRPRAWLAPTTMDRVVALYRDGLPASAVAAEVGCHACTVYSVLRRRGVPWRPRGVRLQK